jgi:hypothetical protein
VHQATGTGRFAGVDPRAYPRDFASFVRYHHALKAVGQRAPLPEPLPWAAVEAFLRRTAGQVRLSPSSPPRDPADQTSP